MDELDALLDALLDAEAAHRLGDGPAARPASAGDIEVPDAPMPLVGAALPDGRTLWFCNRREPVGLARVTPGFIVQHDGRYWRVEETVTYLRLSPYPGTGEEAAEESRETSLPGPAADSGGLDTFTITDWRNIHHGQ